MKKPKEVLPRKTEESTQWNSEICEACDGTGVRILGEGETRGTCPQCKGEGIIKDYKSRNILEEKAKTLREICREETIMTEKWFQHSIPDELYEAKENEMWVPLSDVADLKQKLFSILDERINAVKEFHNFQPIRGKTGMSTEEEELRKIRRKIEVLLGGCEPTQQKSDVKQ